jgi:hypothetical protein
MLAPRHNKTSRSSYTLAQKTFIVDEAYHLVNHMRGTARKYGLSPNMTRRWHNIAQHNMNNQHLLSSTRKRGGGRKPFIPKELKDALVTFVKERRARYLKA